eukprot:6212130-Pleurochrysis_carterae.AAC.1
MRTRSTCEGLFMLRQELEPAKATRRAPAQSCAHGQTLARVCTGRRLRACAQARTHDHSRLDVRA